MLSKIPLINRFFRFPRNSGFCTYDTYCVLAFHGSTVWRTDDGRAVTCSPPPRRASPRQAAVADIDFYMSVGVPCRAVAWRVYSSSSSGCRASCVAGAAERCTRQQCVWSTPRCSASLPYRPDVCVRRVALLRVVSCCLLLTLVVTHVYQQLSCDVTAVCV